MESDIEAALRQAFLTALPAAANSTEFENVAFDPKGKQKWFKFLFEPNTPEVVTLGTSGKDETTGIVSINIYIKEGTGKGNISGDVDALRSVFTAGAALSYSSGVVRVVSCGRNGSGFKTETGFYCYPITINWYSRRNRHN